MLYKAPLKKPDPNLTTILSALVCRISWMIVLRRLPSLLHLVMTILSVPYVLLAVMLVLVGHVFSSRGVWAFLNTLLDSLNWTLTWGLLTLGATLLTIIGLGFFESLRWWAALALAALFARIARDYLLPFSFSAHMG